MQWQVRQPSTLQQSRRAPRARRDCLDQNSIALVRPAPALKSRPSSTQSEVLLSVRSLHVQNPNPLSRKCLWLVQIFFTYRRDFLLAFRVLDDILALVMNNIASTIRAERSRKDWTQTELAKRAGVGLSTIFEAEGGQTEPRLTTLQAIAAALDVPISTLIEDAAPRPTEAQANSQSGQREVPANQHSSAGNGESDMNRARNAADDKP